MSAMMLLASLPEGYELFDPLIDILPIIPVLFSCWLLSGKRQWALSKAIAFTEVAKVSKAWVVWRKLKQT
jgi:hypothetical protein